MRVLMLGWEFPPNKSGGLGTACYGITSALVKKGTEVLFVLPQTDLTEHPVSHVKMRSASGTLVPEAMKDVTTETSSYLTTDTGTNTYTVKTGETGGKVVSEGAETVTADSSIDELHKYTSRLVVRGIHSTLQPYFTAQTYEEYINSLISTDAINKATSTITLPSGESVTPTADVLTNIAETFTKTTKHTSEKTLISDGIRWNKIQLQGGYGKDLMSEVYRYSLAAAQIALEEDFDVVHVHDWMTYPAGILIKKLTGKPLVAHIHALEHDRSGDSVNPVVSHIEWAGMTAADRVVAVSHYTKNEVMQQYKIPGEKISVVHNALNRGDYKNSFSKTLPPHKEKRVLFMSRITFQKGPDYFIEAARLVHEKMPDVHFVMAGSGDMYLRMVRRVSQLRLGTVFHFPGFQTGANVERMYASCDLYVMPSVSEPFGIAPLEAMICDMPVIISRQSGVSEVVQNALKVDFWDIQELANKICAVLAYPKLAEVMVKNSREDLGRIRWSNAAIHLNDIYREVIDRR